MTWSWGFIHWGGCPYCKNYWLYFSILVYAEIHVAGLLVIT